MHTNMMLYLPSGRKEARKEGGGKEGGGKEEGGREGKKKGKDEEGEREGGRERRRNLVIPYPPSSSSSFLCFPLQ